MSQSPALRHNNVISILKEGIAGGWPICLGYFPIGIAFGVIAQKAGFTPVEVAFMSLVVFAGSAQFIGVSMLAAGAGIVPVVMTTFMVNLRHVLMSSSLSLHLGNMPRGWLSLFAYGVTDESFALNSVRFRGSSWDWRRALVLNHTANGAWIASTVAGGVCGGFIPAGAFGIDYALTAMFLCLIVFQVRGGLYVVIAFISGGVAVVLSLIMPGNAPVITASMFAATAGMIIKKMRSSREGDAAS